MNINTLPQHTDVVSDFGVPMISVEIPDLEELQIMCKLLKTKPENLLKQFETIRTIHKYLCEDFGDIKLFSGGFTNLCGVVRKEPSYNSKTCKYNFIGLKILFHHQNFLLNVCVTGSTLHLQHLEVERPHRGKGLAKMILDIILDSSDLNECDITTVPTDLVGTGTTLKRIRDLYSKKGFRRINDYMFKYYHEKVELE